MTRGWRRVARFGVKQREVTRAEQEAGAPERVRSDVISRYAILYPGSHTVRRIWWCRQLNGRSKPGYPSREVAERVAEVLGQFGQATGLDPYLCRRTGPTAIEGEHWHLYTASKLTPTDKGRRVSGDGRESTGPT
jgi:hypothetical protein